MPVYAFKGKSTNGKAVRGEIEATSESEAKVKLRSQRVIPLKVVVISGTGGSYIASKSIVSSGFALFGAEPKVKSKELQIFTRQFATMINSGIPVVQALEILQKQSSSRVLQVALTRVMENVESGKRLGEALEGWPRIFDRLYVSLVKAGEEGGVLDTILNRLATYIEKSVKLKGKVTGALWYPAGIIVVAFGVISVLLTFVIPKFEQLFKSSGQELPALTQDVVALSHWLQNYWWAALGGMILAAYSFSSYYRTPGGRDTVDAVLIQTPLFGPLIQKSSIARFTRTLGTMLSCGVGIIDALEICGNVVGNSIIERAIARAKVAISEGKSITQPLSTEPMIPSMVTQMIGVGEATGTLDTMLSKIADFYEDEVDYAVGALTSMIEPLLMVFLGGIVAFIVIAMYLPIFQLAGTMGV